MICLYLFLGFVVCNSVSAFEFEYKERNDTNADSYNVAAFNVTLDGSYASLGDWPHWCLGNLSRCSNGLTIDMWIKFTEIAEYASEIIVLSSGGHTWYSNGFYLLQVLT